MREENWVLWHLYRTTQYALDTMVRTGHRGCEAFNKGLSIIVRCEDMLHIPHTA